MNKTDVIKGLKLCRKRRIRECTECPYDEIGCIARLMTDALELIEGEEKEARC
jgi:hypothetical protein